MTSLKTFLQLLRVKHYIKNLLVFLALICSGKLFEADRLLMAAIAFASFCIISSAIYVINDLRDAERDRCHPTKKNRPIASGKVSPLKAKCIACILIALALGLNALVFRVDSTILLLLYLVLNIGYSYGLKNIPIIDVSILVSGFLLRVLYGALITGIDVSNWLFLAVMTLSFYMSLGKRRNELRQNGVQGRKVLAFYNDSFLDKNMYMCLTLAIIFYSLWSTDPKTVEMYNSRYLIFTVPFVILISMKYSLSIEGHSDADPVEVLWHDKILLGSCAVYGALMFLILYLR